VTTASHPDGRLLDFRVDGPPDGTVLVLHHGTPGAAVLFDPMVRTAARHGLRTVVYARPGYGDSTPRPGRTVADAAGDVVAVLDAVGADDFLTVGWSGGGPHTLACAALLPERCRAAAVVAGVAPYGHAGELDWTAGMGAENIDEFAAALAGESTLTAYLAREAAGLADVEPGELVAAFGDLISGVDRAALNGGFAEYLAESMRASVRSGIEGWRDDDLAFVRDWAFDPRSVRVPTSFWQGGEDRMVPYAHGEWFAAHVDGARVHLLPDEGHLSLVVDRFSDVVAELLEQAG
jgi:pimeloyl-ACP methyl ester carboxylesterase